MWSNSSVLAVFTTFRCGGSAVPNGVQRPELSPDWSLKSEPPGVVGSLFAAEPKMPKIFLSLIRHQECVDEDSTSRADGSEVVSSKGGRSSSAGPR